MKEIIMFCASIVLCSGPGISGYAQLPSFRFEVITSRDGLPSNTVTTAHRDKAGFMWFGTRLCPVRYDGATFQSFRTPETYLLTSLAIDKDNNVWFGSDQSGVCKIDGKLLRMDSLPRNGGNPQTGDFYIDSHGTGWYSDHSNACRIDLNTLEVKKYPFNRTNFVWIKASFTEDSQQRLWAIGHDNGLFRYDEKLDSMICMWGWDSKDPARKDLVILDEAYGDKDGFLWIATFNRGLVKYNTNNDSLEFFSTGRITNEVRALEEGVDEYGKRIIWVGNEHGLGIFRPDQKKFYYFDNIMDEPYEVFDIYRDPQEGVVWVCTSRGIIKYHPKSNIFQTKNFDLSHLGRPAEINVVHQDNRKGQEHIYYLGLSHSGMIRWDHISDNYSFIPYPASIADTRWIAQREDGTIWIGTNREDYVRPGIFVYDPQQERFVKTALSTIANKYFSVPFFMYGGFDPQNRLWIGNSDEGIHVFDKAGGSEVTPWQDSVQKEYLKDNNLISCLLLGRNGQAWLGAYDGVSQADEQNRVITSIDSSVKPENVGDWAVNSILEDRNSNIWAARWGGITQMSPDRKVLSTYTTADGFYDRENRGLAEDKEGNIWVGNFEGLHRIDPSSKKIFRFTMNDGLKRNFSAGKIFVNREGTELFIGQVGGLNYVNIDNLHETTTAPPLVVSSLKIHDRERHPDLTHAVKLARNDNDFVVDFIALNFRKHQDNQYAYYLEGLENEWHYSGSDHLAAYTNLDPGTYTLHLKAGDAFGNWNYGTVDMQVVVMPAFYETWWFRSLVIMLIAAILYGLYRYRINQLLRLQRIRNRISADLHDELGSSLSSISIIGTMAQQNFSGQHPSRPLVERMVEEIQQISTSLDDIVWNISPRNDALSSLIARMTRYASELFEAKQINFKFTMPEHVDQIRLSMEQRRNFYLVFKESVNNLVKYSFCTEATVVICIENKNLILKIGDNGKGFDPKALTDRNGLQNLKTRADILNGHIKIISTPGQGTLIELRFPLKFNDPKGLLTISGH